MGYTQQQAAEALGLHLRTAQRYDAGGDVPKQTAMACAYLKLLRDLKALLPDC